MPAQQPQHFANITNLHSFALSATCRQLIELTCQSQLPEVPWNAQTLILGEGTNTIFLDNFNGCVLVNKLKGLHVKETATDFLVTAQAGENWHDFVVFLHDKGIHGLENLALIPGTVGAAPVQNIGAYGVEVGTFIEAVAGWDCKKSEATLWSHNECSFGYRSSRFKQPEWRHIIITAVHFRIPKNWQPVLSYKELMDLPENVSATQLMERIIAVRTEKLPDPSDIPNAGSFFKNPTVPEEFARTLKAKYPELPQYPQANGQVKLAAAWLIEQAGLKQVAYGDAAVHQRQALVLINLGSAKGEELKRLAQHIIRVVFETYGVQLEPEVRLISAEGLMAHI